MCGDSLSTVVRGAQSSRSASPPPSLWSQWDASGVGHLALLQVLDQLCEPALGGGVVLQHLGEGAVLQLVGETLTQRLSGSEETPIITSSFFHQTRDLQRLHGLY